MFHLVTTWGLDYIFYYSIIVKFSVLKDKMFLKIVNSRYLYYNNFIEFHRRFSLRLFVWEMRLVKYGRGGFK